MGELSTGLGVAADPSPRAAQVMAAGASALILTVGIARFAYTPLLPVMEAQAGLSAAAGGWLATLNYIGYLCGVVMAGRVRDPQLRLRLYRAGLVTALLTTFAMGLTRDPIAWAVLRWLSGVSSVTGMLLASALVMEWLVHHGRRPELGLHFAGVGLGIALTGVAAMAFVGRLDWAQQWLGFGALSLLLAIPAWAWMPRPHAAPSAGPAPVATAGASLSQHFLVWLQIAYFCAGYAYTAGATFLVAAVARQPDIARWGPATWVAVGLAAAPACAITERLARRLGDPGAVAIASVVQLISLVLLMQHGLAMVALGAVLFGGTFVGIVSQTLTFVGRLSPAGRGRAMARLTLVYGSAQIACPAVTAQLVGRSGGDYGTAFAVATGIMALGTLVFIGLWRAAPAAGRG